MKFFIMNEETINKLKLIQDNIKNLNYNVTKPNIICVSKTFSIQQIETLINFGHYILVRTKFKKQLKNGVKLKR